MIPKIIHQLWKSKTVPSAFLYWQESWKIMHPDFEYRLWTNQDIEYLIESESDQINELYYHYNKIICKMDLARYVILKKYGGLYVDIDFECLKPHHKLLALNNFILGFEPSNHFKIANEKNNLSRTIACNAWMASVPNHPFWMHFLNHLSEVKSKYTDVLDLTGPFALTRAISSYGSNKLTILPEASIYPVDKGACWSGKVQDLEFFEKQTRKSFALHHWVGTWFRETDHLSKLPLPLAKAFVKNPKNLKIKDLDRITNVVQQSKILVSCLMVTRGDPHRVRHSINGFLNQTVQSKELIIVTDIDPKRLILLRSEYELDNIKWIFSDSIDKRSLGELRNLSIDAATGEYIAQWDDDDLFDPSRLEHQLNLIKRSDSTACMLTRWTVWWPRKQRLFISEKRAWEGSLVCKRDFMPRYPALSKGEDTQLIKKVMENQKVVFLNAPRLYIYVIHGENTWHEAHFEVIYSKATVDFSVSAYKLILREVSRRVDIKNYFKKEQIDSKNSIYTDIF